MGGSGDDKARPELEEAGQIEERATRCKSAGLFVGGRRRQGGSNGLFVGCFDSKGKMSLVDFVLTRVRGRGRGEEKEERPHF